MQSISNMDYTVLLISDSYLKSANCMYEVLEVMRDRNYRDKIFPAVIDSGIYSPITRAKYVKHWQGEFRELENELKGINITGIDFHIGSQIMDIGPFKESILKVILQD